MTYITQSLVHERLYLQTKHILCYSELYLISPELKTGLLSQMFAYLSDTKGVYITDNV